MSELRPPRAMDRPFLLELYRDTHRALGAALGLQAPSMLAQQHENREAAFRAMEGALEDAIIWHDGAPVGRCLVSRAADHYRLIDLAVVTQWQDHGIGSEVLGRLAEEARTARLPLRLEVEAINQGAQRLYERLGFRVVGTDGPFHRMELTCEGNRSCSTPTA